MRKSYSWALMCMLAGMALACGESPALDSTAVARSGGREMAAAAVAALPRLAGQQVYVPVYSHIYHHNGMILDLTATVSIRNTSPAGRIIVTAAKYYNTEGRELREYAPVPVELPPLATLEYVIWQNDSSGGSGANFIVDWRSDTAVSTPVIEAVMIGTSGAQGISFTSPGRVISGGN